MVKAVSVGAVLVAASLPLAATAASAATSPSITCSQLSSSPVSANPFTCGSLPYAAAGSTLSFYIFGANFANDNGSAAVSTTAPGVTGQVTEYSATTALVTLYTSATTTPGYYPITLTDDNGTATLALAFGIDPTASVSGAVPSSIAVGSTRLITVTGVGLSAGVATVVPGSGLSISNVTASPDGTSLTFDATATKVGTYSITIGAAQLTLAVTGPAVTSIAVASSTGYLVSGSSVSSQMVTISGSGFETGASVQVDGVTLPGTIDGVTFSAPTVVSDTSITTSATVPTSGMTVTGYNVTVINPDGTMTTTNAVGGALGFGRPNGALVTNSATLSLVSNNLVPGGNASITVMPSAGFTVTSGAVVSLSVGSLSFSGTAVVNSDGSITIYFYLPVNLSTTLSAAIGAGVTQLPLTNLSGIGVGTALTFADNGDGSTVLAVNPSSSSVTVAPTANAHASGTVVQWPISTIGLTFTLSINNGTQTASLANVAVSAGSGATYSFLNTQGVQEYLTTGSFPIAAGTYTYLFNTPGANMGTGTKVVFTTSTGTNPDGVTGTVVATGQDTATVRVTVAGGPASTQAAILSGNATAGNTYIVTTTPAGLTNGEKLTFPSYQPTTGNGSLGDPPVNETVTISNSWVPGTEPVLISGSGVNGGLQYNHNSGDILTTGTTAVVPSIPYYATIINAAGVESTFPFATTASADFGMTSALVNGTQNIDSGGTPLNGTTVTLTNSVATDSLDGQSLVDATTGSYIGTVLSNTTTVVTLVSGAAAPITGSDLLGFGSRTVGNNAGLGGMPASLTINGNFTDHAATDYVVSSTTPGVTFGSVSAVTATSLKVSMMVAAGTPVNTNVQLTVVDLSGEGTVTLPSTTQASSGLLIGVAPTITAVSAIPTLTSGESATVTITGTGFDPTAAGTVFFAADAGNLAGGADMGTALGNDLNGISNTCTFVSSTTITCVVSVGDGASNGQHDVYLQNFTGGVATFANVLNVSMPTVGTVTPGTGSNVQTLSQTYILSGITGMTVSPTNLPYVSYSTFNASFGFASTLPNGNNPRDQQYEWSANSVSYYGPNAISVTISAPYVAVNGYLVFTLEDVTGTAAGNLWFDAPAIALGNPIGATDTGVALTPGTSTSFTINTAGPTTDRIYHSLSYGGYWYLQSCPGTDNNSLDPAYGLLVDTTTGYTAPILSYDQGNYCAVTLGAPIAGSTGTLNAGDYVTYDTMTSFLPGATVTSATPGITVSGASVLPGMITGTVNIASTVAPGTYSLLVTNPDGSIAVSTVTVNPGPSVASVNGTTTISGPVSFLAGTQATLTISGSNFQQGVVVSTTTPGIATFGTAVVNGAGTQITVPVTFTNFSGATPVSLNLVLTNPTTGGSTTVPAELVVNPTPTVIGTYYVPTFTSNTQVVISGTGFESGITATSSNKDYTVVAVSSTPSTVTLLVTTDSNATSGTSSNVTLTNPDGGTVSFALNGGPNPNTLPKTPHAIRTVGPVWTGKTSTVRIVGHFFFGQPKVTSNVGGTRVGVVHDTGSILTLRVTVAKTTKRGVHTFTITFANGDVTTVKYNQR